MKSTIQYLMLPFLAFSGCIGFSFGPGYAAGDQNYFAEPPVIVKQDENYYLRWRYGTMGFYYEPRYAMREGGLWFSLQGTSSSGNLAGREGTVLIKGEKEIAALEKGGAFWWASNDSLLPIPIVLEQNKPEVANGGKSRARSDHHKRRAYSATFCGENRS